MFKIFMKINSRIQHGQTDSAARQALYGRPLHIGLLLSHGSQSIYLIPFLLAYSIYIPMFHPYNGNN